MIWLLSFSANIAVTALTDSKEKLDSLIFFTSLSGGIAGAIGVVQMLLFRYSDSLRSMFNPFWHMLDNAVAKLCTEILLPESIVENFQRTEFICIPHRASGTFTNPVFYAIFLVIVAPLAVHSIFFSDSRKKRITSLFCFIFSAAGIAVSYSRGPYLAFALSFVILFFYGKKHILKLFSIAVAMISVVAVAGNDVLKRLLTIFSSDDISINTRSDIWKACFDMLDGHWLFGYGTGVSNVREQLHNTYSINQPHAHNLFLEILLENGIIGALILLSVFIFFFIRMIKLSKKGAFEKSIAVTCLSSVIGFCFCSMTDYPVYGIKPVFYFMLILGIAESAYTLSTKPSDIPYTIKTKELTYER